jgi:hypothetical protein
MAFVSLGLAALVGCGGGNGSDSESQSSISLESVFPVRGSALGGTLIRMTGEGFSADTRVKIGGQDCDQVTALNPTELTCVTPAHAQGDVDLQVINRDGRKAVLQAAHSYRPSGTGMSSFGILAAAPLQGIYPDPFSAKLESVLTGFDVSTLVRSWVVDGKTYNEGDTVTFGEGRHTVTLSVQDASGDADIASYTIIVGPMEKQDGAVAGRVSALAVGNSDNTFELSAGRSISLVNTGMLPLSNPRLIGAGKPDYVDWSRYLKSLGQLANLPADATESSRAKLLEAAWKDLSNATVHVCSPGRETEHINDPALLVRGYGYECCSNASRALAFLGAFLDIPARVRTTLAHEYPEFTVNGQMFILDPDLRYRFWGENQLPLSGWTSASTPVSLQNVSHYFAQTPKGGYYETQSGGTLPLAASPQYPEQDIRGFYFNDIIADTDWGYHEAFSGSKYVVHPNEKMVFRLSSTYVPLQWRNSDGTPTGGSHAPAVGKVMFRRLWSASGPRSFSQDAEGHRTIPLNDLPYPVQDLTFYFSKPINPEDFWLTSGGKAYRIGDFTANTWTVSSQQLRVFTHTADLAAVVSSNENLVAVDIGMQFNPKIFGDPAGPVSLRYADDSGDCQRQVGVTTGGGTLAEVALGSSLCDAAAPQRVETSYEMSMGQAGVSLVSSYGNSYQGTWGLVAAAGVKGYAEISLPRTPGLPGTLRATTQGFFADWEIDDGGHWTPLNTTDAAMSQWVELPATSSSTSRLRLRLRSALAKESTYLAYMSLIEGRSAWSPFLGPPTDPLQRAASVR